MPELYSKEDILAELEYRKYNLFYYMFPDEGVFARSGYIKHTEFFQLGADNRVRLFRAANRVGKTNAGGYEVVCHLTGEYPEWWQGKRFNKPVDVLVAGETGTLVRDTIQKKLMGASSEIGTGLIPQHKIVEKRPRSGIPDAFDTVSVQHATGGYSSLQFQSYDQGREKFQGSERDVIWLDEEPPMSVYTEALTRTMTTQGIVMLTFTPLKGMSETVQFLDSQAKDGGCAVITATWDDAPHLSETDKEEMIKAFPPHQRDARSKGIPALGSGAIYPVPESEFVMSGFEVPKHWKHCYAMDVGWNNTAAVFAAIDPENDVVYITGCYKAGQKEPSLHADAIRRMARGKGKPGVIDPASRGRSQADGQQLLTLYRQLGLNVVEADNAVEAGIYEVWQRLSTGRIKVFATCTALLEEYRVYRRDEKGRIVKENDHCFAGDTLVHTENGVFPIKSLVGTSGRIISLNGELQEYHSCRMTKENAELVAVTFDDGSVIKCTPEHKFLTADGFIEAIDLTGYDCYNGVSEANRVKSCKNSTVKGTIFAVNTIRTMVSGFIGKYGSFIAGNLYQKATTFTTSMVTGLITTIATFRCCLLKSISEAIYAASPRLSVGKLSMQLGSGTSHQAALSGTKNIMRELKTSYMSALFESAPNAESNTIRLGGTVTRSAQTSVRRLIGAILELTQSFVAAPFVKKNLLLTNTGRQKPVQNHAVTKCLHVQRLKKREDVYCLTVPYNNLFTVGSGIVVHNCVDALRYLIMSGLHRAEQDGVEVTKDPYKHHGRPTSWMG